MCVEEEISGKDRSPETLAQQAFRLKSLNSLLT
jgi:hypothetical protein